jgi:D-glycerate 3-kinase
MSGSPTLIDAVFDLATRTREPGTTLLLGINGPQGGGKSTTAAGVVQRARAAGLAAVALSIDDFYLTRDQQVDLASRHPGNRYLEHRGYPGTHDVALGVATLDALRTAHAGDEVALPVYDKGAHAGRGDRAARSAWPTVSGPIDLVVFEGWMLGFTPAEAEPDEPALQVAAAHLGAYAAWTERLDAFVHLEAEDLDAIVEWRIDAERARRNAGAAGLTDDDARDYIERFLPAYRLWVPALRAGLRGRGGRPIPSLTVRLGRDRDPLEIATRT